MIFYYWAHKSSGSWSRKLTGFFHINCIRFHILSAPANTQTWTTFCLSEPLQAPSSSSCFFYVLCFCLSPQRSFSFFLALSTFFPSCLMYLVLLLNFYFFKVRLEKASTFPEIHKWDIRSTGPWRSLNTDYFRTKWTLFWVPREPALLPSLWEGLLSVHSQLSLLWEGPGSATETGRGSTGKYICECQWRSWTLSALTYWCCTTFCVPAKCLIP